MENLKFYSWLLALRKGKKARAEEDATRLRVDVIINLLRYPKSQLRIASAV